MPAPLILGGLALLGVGLPVGWKLGRWIFGEEVEPLPLPGSIEKSYDLQVMLLDYSLGDNFIDKKIYAYYLMSLILGHQQTLLKLKTQVESNGYIEYIKNTKPEWEQTIVFIKEQVNSTLYRYLCYESLMKNIFDIPYDEKNFEIIGEKFKTFDYLTELQFNKLLTWIINPIFNGWYDFEAKDIQVVSCPELVTNASNCTKFVVKSFPAPATILDPNGHKSGAIDAIMPLSLENAIISEKKLGKELIDGWLGFVDVGIQQFTGIKAGYQIKTAEALNELAGTSADFYDNMRKEFRAFRTSLSSAYSNAGAGLSGFTEALTIAGIGLAAYFAYNTFIAE